MLVCELEAGDRQKLALMYAPKGESYHGLVKGQFGSYSCFFGGGRLPKRRRESRDWSTHVQVCIVRGHPSVWKTYPHRNPFSHSNVTNVACVPKREWDVSQRWPQDLTNSNLGFKLQSIPCVSCHLCSDDTRSLPTACIEPTEDQACLPHYCAQ